MAGRVEQIVDLNSEESSSTAAAVPGLSDRSDRISRPLVIDSDDILSSGNISSRATNTISGLEAAGGACAVSACVSVCIFIQLITCS